MDVRRSILRILPFLISMSLLIFVIWWVSPRELIEAARQLRWQLLLPPTAAMVFLLYLADALCLPVVYRVNDQPVRYPQALHVRGFSYLIGAFNYEAGQAGVAWGMARLQQASLLRMLSRSVLLAYHDALVLLTMGLVGSLLTTDSDVLERRPYIGIALAVTVAAGVVLWNLPQRVRNRLQASRLAAILADWQVSRSVRLVPLRCLYFGILVVYASVALRICGIPVGSQVVLSTIPLVLLAEGLPNFAGLGTRETALVLLLDPPENGVLLAMSLFWSAGMIFFRLLIGLGHYWYHAAIVRQRQEQPIPQPTDEI